MATAAETYTWATYGSTLKTYLGVSGSTEDTMLTAYLAAAAQDCDDFVGSGAFTDDDGEDIVHTAKIWLGICEWVKAFRAWATRSVGVTSVSTGAWSETYSANSDSALKAARTAAIGLWTASVSDVSLMGV